MCEVEGWRASLRWRVTWLTLLITRWVYISTTIARPKLSTLHSKYFKLFNSFYRPQNVVVIL